MAVERQVNFDLPMVFCVSNFDLPMVFNIFDFDLPSISGIFRYALSMMGMSMLRIFGLKLMPMMSSVTSPISPRSTPAS